jgi:hypothetical protein
VGIVAVDSQEELEELIDKDPASKLNTYEYHPMRAIVANALTGI